VGVVAVVAGELGAKAYARLGGELPAFFGDSKLISARRDAAVLVGCTGATEVPEPLRRVPAGSGRAPTSGGLWDRRTCPSFRRLIVRCGGSMWG
jgi:hypothetical protein